MNRCWIPVLIAILLLPNVAVPADSATSRTSAASVDSAGGAGQKEKPSQKKGDVDAVIAALTEAIQRDPNDAKAYDDRGVAYEAKGEIDKAIADYTEALRLDPKSSAAYYNRGIAYAKKSELDKAIADYTEAIGLNPKLGVAYSNRAAAYAKKGEKAKAEEDFAQAEKLGVKRPTAAGEAGGPATPLPWWVLTLLSLAAVVCLGLYWMLRRQRLSTTVKKRI